MSSYVLRRLLQVIPTLFGILTVLFILAYLMPSDPLRAVLGEQYRRLSPEVVDGIREELGLNKPFLERYGEYLGQILHGNLGRSYVLEENVSDIIAYRFPRTLQLMAGGLLVGLLIGIPAGIIAAQKQYQWADHVLMVISLIGVSVPIFWLALLAQLFLTQSKYGIALFPVAGYEDGSIMHMILPSLVLGTNLSATLARVTRSAMLEVKAQDYIVTARCKGTCPARRPDPASTPQRADPDHHGRRPGHRLPAWRVGRHRDDLQLARLRSCRRPGNRAPRHAGDLGHPRLRRVPVRDHQPFDRSSVCAGQPAHSL